MDFHAQQNFNILPWSVISPNFSSIDQIPDEMKRWLRNLPSYSTMLAEITSTLVRIWNNIPLKEAPLPDIYHSK
jgi:hypothetical protein